MERTTSRDWMGLDGFSLGPQGWQAEPRLSLFSSSAGVKTWFREMK